MTPDRRAVSLTSTSPGGVVVEVQLSAPDATSPDALRSRLEHAVRHVVEIFDSGMAIEVAVGDVWISGWALR